MPCVFCPWGACSGSPCVQVFSQLCSVRLGAWCQGPCCERDPGPEIRTPAPVCGQPFCPLGEEADSERSSAPRSSVELGWEPGPFSEFSLSSSQEEDTLRSLTPQTFSEPALDTRHWPRAWGDQIQLGTLPSRNSQSARGCGRPTEPAHFFGV